MKHKTIGLLGAAVSNENLGCVALTYSLIQSLEKISRQINSDFDYYIFEGRTDSNKVMKMCSDLRVDTNRVQCFSIYFQYSLKSGLYHLPHSIAAYAALRKCDLFIDLTNGDSFTDIYGQGRFDGTTKIKELVQKWNVPLVLGPQTYGPFNNPKNINRAKKVIESANCVIARDQASADYIKSFSDQTVHVTTDLAFGLPYRKEVRLSEKVCVGLNISSLLLSNKTESTQRNFRIRTDYDQFIVNILDYLVERKERYKTYVIPHVGVDGGIQFKEGYPEIEFLQAFTDPVSAKSFISSMDVFIGARMHATIGAFSSGVATIPIAYSRKFKGLYDTLSYEYVVDLQTLSTEEATKKTIEYIESRDTLKNAMDKGRQIYTTECKNNDALLQQCLEELSLDDSKSRTTFSAQVPF